MNAHAFVMHLDASTGEFLGLLPIQVAEDARFFAMDPELPRVFAAQQAAAGEAITVTHFWL